MAALGSTQPSPAHHAATAWNPAADGPVQALALALSGSVVCAGGYFTSIGGQWRSYLAALDAATGTSAS